MTKLRVAVKAALPALVALSLLPACSSLATTSSKAAAKQFSALILAKGVLQEVQSHNQTISRDNDLGLKSQVVVDCRDAYQALPGWRSTITGAGMPANVTTPFNRALNETEAAYKTCVQGDFTQTSAHFSAAYTLYGKATKAVERWQP